MTSHLLLFVKNHRFLLLILLFAAFLRIWQLGDLPVGLHGDEASIGYSAYSLYKTGKDETGAPWPLSVNQFGDFRPAGYYYLDIPFIAALGLNEFAVRLPSAIFGSLYIFVFYLLLVELFHKKNLALLAALLLTVSPWHIIISRATSEGVVSTFFVLLATLFLLKSVTETKIKFWMIGISVACFAFSFFFYHAARLFVPVFFPLLVVFLLFRAKRTYRDGLVFVGAYILILASLFFFMTTGGGIHRASQIGIFSIPGNQNTLTQQIAEEPRTQPVLITRFFHNKLILNLRMFLLFYFQHFSGEFLFSTTGKPIRYTVPWSGSLYLIELPLLLFGFSVLLSDAIRQKKYVYLFPLFWLIIGAIPAGLTWEDTPNIQRSALMIPALYVIIAFGITELYHALQQKPVRTAIMGIIAILFFHNVTSFFHNYFYHLKTHEPWHRSAAAKELVTVLPTIAGNYTKVLMTTDGNNNFILYLFYNQLDPATFHASGAPREHEGLMVGNIQYVGNPCPLGGNTTNFINDDPRILYVNSYTCKDPENAEIIRVIRHPDTSGAYKLIKIDPDYLLKKAIKEQKATQ